ncbi:MAG TPA: hypothetical protein VGE24_05960 [Emticicia sp.]
MNNQKSITFLKIIAIPIIYLLVLIFIIVKVQRVGSWFSIMYYGFVLLLPLIVGTLTVYLSSKEEVRNWKYKITAPWVPIFMIFILLACSAIQNPLFLLMILPIFMTTASVGGLVGGYLKLREENE